MAARADRAPAALESCLPLGAFEHIECSQNDETLRGAGRLTVPPAFPSDAARSPREVQPPTPGAVGMMQPQRCQSRYLPLPTTQRRGTCPSTSLSTNATASSQQTLLEGGSILVRQADEKLDVWIRASTVG